MRIEIRNLKKEYNRRTVLHIEHLTMESGKIHAIMGPNGSGKSTLLRLISGMEACTDGEILYNGKKQIPAGQIRFLLQKPYMFNQTVLENMLLGVNKKEKELAMQALKAVGMEGFTQEKACSLSGGEVQKVAIARTLVTGSSLLLLDEPLAAVDITSTSKIDQFIVDANKAGGSSIIIATHSPAEALRVADQAIFLWDGRIMEKGTPETVVHSPVSKQAKEFMQSWRI